MAKFRRFMVEIVDLFTILVIAFFSKEYFSFYSLTFLGIAFWLLKDCIWSNGSIGKQIFAFQLCSSKKKSNRKCIKLILHNFFDMIFFPISLICCLLFGWSIGDIYYQEELKLQEKTMNFFQYDLCYLFFLIAIVILLIFETLNYYSIRLLLCIVICFLIMTIYRRFTINFKFAKFVSVIIFIMITMLISNLLSQVKFENLEDCFYYTFPYHKIKGLYEFEGWGYIIHERDNEIFVSNYLKSNNFWIAKSHTSKNFLIYSETEKIISENKVIVDDEIINQKKYSLFASPVFSYDKVLLVIVSNFEIEQPNLYNIKTSEKIGEFSFLYSEGDNYIYVFFSEYKNFQDYVVQIDKKIHSFGYN